MTDEQHSEKNVISIQSHFDKKDQYLEQVFSNLPALCRRYEYLASGLPLILCVKFDNPVTISIINCSAAYQDMYKWVDKSKYAFYLTYCDSNHADGFIFKALPLRRKNYD